MDSSAVEHSENILSGHGRDGILIRTMQKGDIPAVAKLERRIFLKPWSEKSFLEAYSSEHNIYLVATTGEMIAGYCGIWVSFDTADLCNIAVAPEYRRRGIAEDILEEAVQRVKMHGVERILLEVRESNQGALCLYQKLGFGQIGTRRGYYSAPREDALLMQLSLSH